MKTFSLKHQAIVEAADQKGRIKESKSGMCKTYEEADEIRLSMANELHKEGARIVSARIEYIRPTKRKKG